MEKSKQDDKKNPFVAKWLFVEDLVVTALDVCLFCTLADLSVRNSNVFFCHE